MPGIDYHRRPTAIRPITQHARAVLPACRIFRPGAGNCRCYPDAELQEMIERATYLALNDYEAEMMQARTGLTLSQLAGRVEAWW